MASIRVEIVLFPELSHFCLQRADLVLKQSVAFSLIFASKDTFYPESQVPWEEPILLEAHLLDLARLIVLVIGSSCIGDKA